MQQKVEQLPLFELLWVKFEQNKQRVLWGGATVIVVGLVAWYYVRSQSQNEISAGEELSKAMATELFTGGMQSAPPETYLKVAKDYPGTPAAAQAVLLAGERYFTEGKYVEAQTQFERFSREFGGNPFVSQALLGKAAALEAQGKLEDAARFYKEAGDRFAQMNVGPLAKYSLARIYESQSKADLARGLYEEISRTYPYHSLARESAMRAEELRIKTPPPPAPAPAAVVPNVPTRPTTSNAPTFNLGQPK